MAKLASIYVKTNQIGQLYPIELTASQQRKGINGITCLSYFFIAIGLGGALDPVQKWP